MLEFIWSKIVSRVLLISLSVIVSILVLFLLSQSIPLMIDYFIGDSIIKNNLNEVVGNESNSLKIAQKLMDWEYNNTFSLYSQKVILTFPLPIFQFNNKTIIFIRSNKASWVILMKLGNCGENSDYFVELMNKSGFKSRFVQALGEDHSIAEFYDENGRKWIVDPSNDEFINDTLKLGSSNKWSRVVAVDLSGNEEDLTKDYIANRSELQVYVNGPDFLSERTSIDIDSTYLMETVPKIYSNPLHVVSNVFNLNRTFSIELGRKKEYQMTTFINFYILDFEYREKLDLNQNKNLQINTWDYVKIDNIRPTVGTYFSLLLFVLILLIVGNRRKLFHMKIKAKKLILVIRNFLPIAMLNVAWIVTTEYYLHSLDSNYQLTSYVILALVDSYYLMIDKIKRIFMDNYVRYLGERVGRHEVEIARLYQHISDLENKSKRKTSGR